MSAHVSIINCLYLQGNSLNKEKVLTRRLYCATKEKGEELPNFYLSTSCSSLVRTSPKQGGAVNTAPALPNCIVFNRYLLVQYSQNQPNQTHKQIKPNQSNKMTNHTSPSSQYAAVICRWVSQDLK